jgi:hypothetical protein
MPNRDRTARRHKPLMTIPGCVLAMLAGQAIAASVGLAAGVAIRHRGPWVRRAALEGNDART